MPQADCTRNALFMCYYCPTVFCKPADYLFFLFLFFGVMVAVGMAPIRTAHDSFSLEILMSHVAG